MTPRAPSLVRLGLVGFGSVGRAFAELVSREHAWILADRGVDLVVTGITTGRSGAVVDADGVDVPAALQRAQDGLVHGPALEAATFAATAPVDVVVETLPLEPFSGALASVVVRAALLAGRNVVSANKGPVAHHLAELSGLAREQGVFYRYESAVADGMPVFNLVRHCMPAADITAFTGVVNSTSNLVLDSLAGGRTLAEGVAAAQELGVTEADPSYDLDGWDATVKLASLSAAVWGEPLPVDAVQREAVGEGSAARAGAAAKAGRRLVSLASLERFDDGVQASVRLVELGPRDDFFALSAADLGLRITSRLLSPITVTSSNPLPADTAYGLLADVLGG